jgi:hypothetical protein
MCLRSKFLETRETAFQQFFVDVMERAYPGDFIAITAWGSSGDLKNDGFHRSERRLFGCYAPKRMEAAKTIKKVSADYGGACLHWDGHFEEWAFVHNQIDGVPAPIAQKILAMQGNDSKHPIAFWGFAKLRSVVFSLSEDDLLGILGDTPTMSTMLAVGFEDLQPLIDAISTKAPQTVTAIRVVPPEKLAANAFSEVVAELLRSGMTKADLVGEYFHKHHDPEFHDRASSWFRERYLFWKDDGCSPDTIYDRLRRDVGGMGPPNATRESAVYAILSYFFGACEIFEPFAAV